MKISIIGAGRLGTTLGRALNEVGHRIDVVVTNHTASAKRAAATIGARETLTREQLQRSPHKAELFRQSDLLVISTPDDAIHTMASQLAKVLSRRTREASRRVKVAVHTSGALSSESLAPLRKAGFAVGSLHPLVSVARPGTARGIFRGTYFCLEGDRAAAQVAGGIVKQLGGHSFSIPSQRKPLYHAAATLSSGHIVALFALAIELLEDCGISPRRAQKILLPLLESTIKNLETRTPANAITGPLARDDFATIGKHLAAMDADGLKDAARIYAIVGERVLKLATFSSTDSQQRDRIAKLLAVHAR